MIKDTNTDFRYEVKLTPESFKNKLIYLRDNYTDVIPEEIISSATPPTPEGKEYKVRKAWFMGIAMLVGIAEFDKVLPVEVLEQCRDFLDFVSSYDFKRRLTTKEDIDYGNSIINKVISALDLEKQPLTFGA